MKNSMKLGKTQTFSREINTELVLRLLKQQPCSGTEIATKLSLSHATVSSIIKQLLSMGIIKIEETKSMYGLGRKRVLYVLNPNYGLILGVNISNLHATISLIDFASNVLVRKDVLVDKYNRSAIYELVLESSKLLIDNNAGNIPLKTVVIALPGRVNNKTGELILSSQFDSELFTEQHFIRRAFEKQFASASVLLANDNTIMTYGELYEGDLKNVENGVYFNIDYGVGGGIVINKELYVGDMGYAGEFGLIRYYNGEEYQAIDEFISLRSLIEKSSKILNKEITRDELFVLFEENEQIKKIVLESATIVGRALVQIGDVFDINKFVISGRATKFGDQYYQEIINSSAGLINQPTIIFSRIGRDAEILGTTAYGIEEIFTQIKMKVQE